MDLGAAPAPDETTICRFRHLIEKHDLYGMMLNAVNLHLEAQGIRIATGTTFDATIIYAPLSTKNATHERDPEKHQTKKGNRSYFGLKAHIGVDAKACTVHTVVTTAANVADSRVLPALLHGDKRKVWRDGGYQGQTKAIQEGAPNGKDMRCKRTRYKNRVDQLERAKNRSKSSVRPKVEHPFRILKRIFGFDKVRYRGLAKNHHRFNNLLRARQPHPPPQTPGRTHADLRLKSTVDPFKPNPARHGIHPHQTPPFPSVSYPHSCAEVP